MEPGEKEELEKELQAAAPSGVPKSKQFRGESVFPSGNWRDPESCLSKE